MIYIGTRLLGVAVAMVLINPLADLATKLLPKPEATQKTVSRNLDPHALSLPAVALGQAMREVLRMADLATEMLQLSIQAFEEGVICRMASLAYHR